MKLPGYIKHDLGLKLVALALALFLWVSVAERREVELTVDLPIKYTKPTDMTFASQVPQKASVRIRGRSKFLRWKLKDVYFAVDFSAGEEGINTHNVSPGEAVIPPDKDLEILEVLHPKAIRVELDQLVTRKLPPRVTIQGELPKDKVMIGHPRSEPKEVVVYGALQLIQPLDSVPTMPVSLEQLAKKGGVEARLDLSKLPYVESDVDRVVLTARIESKKELGIPSVPLEVPDRKGMKILFTPDSLDVVIAGAESLIDSLDPTEVKLAVEVGDLPKGQLVFSPEIREGKLYFEVRPAGGADEGQVFELRARLEAPRNFELISAAPGQINFVKR